MAHKVLQKTEKFGIQIGTVEDNFCNIYDVLISEWDTIEKHFYDTDKEFFNEICKSDWSACVQILCQTMCHLGMEEEFEQRIKFLNRNSEFNTFAVAGDMCASSRYFGLAFGLYDLAISFHIFKHGFQGLDDSLIVKAKQVQAAIELNMEAHEEEFKVFNFIWSQNFTVGNKCTMYQFIDMQLDNKIYHVYDKNYNGDKKHEAVDVLIRFLDKRLRYEFFPSGKTNFLFRLLEAALKYAMSRDVYRYKQAVHLISATAKLMNTVNQETIAFRKVKDLYLLTKTIYLGEIISLTELRNVVNSYPKVPELAKMCPNLSDRLCMLKVDLSIEDPDLPLELLDTDQNLRHLYDLIPLYGEQLDRSYIPEIRFIFSLLEKVQLNYFRFNIQFPPPLPPPSAASVELYNKNYNHGRHYERRYQRNSLHNHLF